MALAGMLVPLNSTMIAVALPRLVEDLHTSLRSATWLVTAYLIAMASLQPLAGKIGDRLGRRPLVLGGLAWLAVASAGAAASDALVPLVAFRLQQAVAGALVMPNATALLRETVPVERLGATMGGVGAMFALGAAAGPPLGGLLIGIGGWRAIFLVNLPLVAVALALGARSLPRAAPRHAARAGHVGAARFDRAGALLLPATLAAGAWALNGAGLTARAALVLGAAAVALLAVLVRVELRRADPILEPRLFANRAFGAAAGGVALANLAMYVTLLALPVLVARRGGVDGASAGVLLATMSGASLLVTPLGGRLVDRAGARRPAVAGLSLLAVALTPLALVPAALGAPALVACLAAAGAGLGLASSALQVAAVSAVAPGMAGAASGVFLTSRYAGSIAGSALLAGPLAPAAEGTAGFGALFAVLVVAAAGSAAVALRLPGGQRRDATLGPLRPAPARS